MNYEHKYRKYKAKYLRSQQNMTGGNNHMGGALSLQETIDSVKHINNIINNIFDDSQKQQVASEMSELGTKLGKAKDLKWRLVGKALKHYSDVFKSMGLPSVVKQYAEAYMPKSRGQSAQTAQSETSSIMMTAQPAQSETSPLMPAKSSEMAGGGLDPQQFKQQLISFLQLIKNGLEGEQRFAGLVENIMKQKKLLEHNVGEILQNPLAQKFGREEIAEGAQYLGKQASESIERVLSSAQAYGRQAQEALKGVNVQELGHKAQAKMQELSDLLKQSPAMSETVRTPAF